MNQPAHIINVARQLQGMPIIVRPQGERAGYVVEALVRPPGDRLSGLICVHAFDVVHVLGADDLVLLSSDGVVLVDANAGRKADHTHQALNSGILVRRFVAGGRSPHQQRAIRRARERSFRACRTAHHDLPCDGFMVAALARWQQIFD